MGRFLGADRAALPPKTGARLLPSAVICLQGRRGAEGDYRYDFLQNL